MGLVRLGLYCGQDAGKSADTAECARGTLRFCAWRSHLGVEISCYVIGDHSCSG